jgi:hypothetical protein
MKPAQRQPWADLFGSSPDAPGGNGMSVRVLCRGGRPFLLLPAERRGALGGLELYSPQKPRAKFLKSLLKLAIRFGAMLIFPKTTLFASEGDPFVEYLAREGGWVQGQFGPLAILAGNPNTPGQRFVLLLLDSPGQPTVIIKAGVTADAMSLIDHEERFLRSLPRGMESVPELRSAYKSERIAALAMDFIAGQAPNDWTAAQVEQILSPWVDQVHRVTVEDMPLWQRFERSRGTGAALPPHYARLAMAVLHPVIYHGDFTPWNIRGCDGAWKVLDWERGERVGIPLWDWLHFTVQPAILVEEAAPEELLKRIEGLFETQEIVRYLALTEASGWEQALCLAYLDYCLGVLKPSEGAESLRQLAALACRKWLGAGE